MIQVRLNNDVNVPDFDILREDLMSYRLYFKVNMKMYDIFGATVDSIDTSINTSVANKDLQIKKFV